MSRAYLEDLDVTAAIAAGEIALDATTAKRFTKVLRLKEGDRVEVFGAGRRLSGTLHVGPPTTLNALEELPPVSDIPPTTLAQAMTKTNKLEEVVRRAGELGAHEIVLFVAERTQGRLRDDKQRRSLIERLERIAVDASRQCGRTSVCRIVGPLSFGELCSHIDGAPSLSVFGALDADLPLSQALQSDHARLLAEGVVVVIGPEGGLSPSECTALTAAGAMRVRLAAHTLRTETAGLAALAAVQAASGTL